MNRILEHPKTIARPVAIILAYPALDFNYTSWMSPNNLRVLQTEQSETHIPGLLHGKDHMRHKSPLSVVDDVGKKPKSKRPTAKTRKSWADSISGALGMSPATATSGSKTQPSSPLTMTRPLSKRTESGWFASREEGADSSAAEDISDLSSEEEDEDEPDKPDRRRDADKSLAERVKTPGVRADERFTDGILSMSPSQEVPDDEAPLAGPLKPKAKAAFATRLTMTSRVGYFQDRVISPSMMRAMAILYVGPQRCPDFETDYYISPLLSPAENLAHFPPVYLICGERDPFVDDTVIFAGKLREAKRTRRSQAANGSEKKGGTKYGEGLRMTTGKPNEDVPDHILRETDEDWVQMRIIEGWGHGFMQMSTLMKEVDSVLVEMADWIDESFERNRLLEKDKEDVAAAHAAARAAFAPDTPVHQTTQDNLPSPLRSTHVKPVREYTHTPKDKPVGDADLGVDFGPESDNEDNIVTFTPKNKKRTPPPSQFNPVPRRPSREGLKRDNSALNFDSMDDLGSSGETVLLRTPPQGRVVLPTAPAAPKGMASFGLFSRPSNTTPRGPVAVTKTPATSLYATIPGARRGSSPIPTLNPSSNNPLVKAAVASARAASPALAAAGFVPQSVTSVDPEEMYRRRRAEAVFGMEDDGGSDK